MNRIQKKSIVKVCVVCGDRANGYNFNAISCESCKAFFRRNALRKKGHLFKCTFDNNCEINVVSRKFCQMCRLQKCLNQGMNKNLILSDEEKQFMKRKVQENRQKRKFCHKENVSKDQYSNYSNENSLTVNNIFVQNFLSSYQQDQNIITKPVHINRARHQSVIRIVGQDQCNRRSEDLDNCFLLRNFEHIFHRETEDKRRNINTIAGLLAEDSADGSPEYCGVQKAVPFSANRGLNFIEQSRLIELKNAFLNNESTYVELIPECVNHSDILRLIELSVRRLIKKLKRIECFTSLCSLDQIALMKAGCTRIGILRSVQGYNFEQQTWTINNGATVMTMDQYKRSTTPTIYEMHKRFMQMLSQEWDSDPDTINLLSMITLFNANRPDIIHKQLIAFEYESHKYLLLRHLEAKYSSKFDANKKFMKLMSILEELHYLNEESVRWHLETDPQQIGPLLIEILDLKY